MHNAKNLTQQRHFKHKCIGGQAFDIWNYFISVRPTSINALPAN
jgi:hypothetical protein